MLLAQINRSEDANKAFSAAVQVSSNGTERVQEVLLRPVNISDARHFGKSLGLVG